MSLAKKGRLYLEKYPKATPADLMENCGFKAPYARMFIYAHKRKIHDEAFLSQFATEVPEPPDWHQNYKGAVMQINSLEKQIIGYKAVINYLEHQLAAAHGSSV